MKQSLLLLLSVVSMLHSDAQKAAFTDPSNKWRLLRVNAEDKLAYPYEVIYTADTIIGAYTYRRFSNSGIGLRADTARGLLYFRYVVPLFSPVSATDTVERVLFDYRLGAGDTFKLDEGPFQFRHIVKKLDSVRIGGYDYRAWHMQPADTAGNQVAYIFVESLGTLAGPGFSAFPVRMEECRQLRCFSRRGVTNTCTPALPLPCYVPPHQIEEGYYPASFFDNSNSCEPGEVAVYGTAAQPGIFYPDPGGVSMQMILPADCRRCIARVYDATGRIDWQRADVAARVIPIGQYLTAAGIYFYILQDAVTGRRYTGRFTFR